jgi:hypothetical protein
MTIVCVRGAEAAEREIVAIEHSCVEVVLDDQHEWRI